MTAEERTGLRQRLAAARALVGQFAPGSEGQACAQGALHGLSERAAAVISHPRTLSWRAAVALLAAGGDPPPRYGDIASQHGLSYAIVRAIAHRLRTVGLLALLLLSTAPAGAATLPAAPAPERLSVGPSRSVWWVEGWTAAAEPCDGPWPLLVQGGAGEVRCAIIEGQIERLVLDASGRCRVVEWAGAVIERRWCVRMPVIVTRPPAPPEGAGSEVERERPATG